MYDTIDITDRREHGADLMRHIREAVKDTQLFLIRPYPDKLLMTMEQFDELKPDDGADPNGMLFTTPDCVMEVKVKGYTLIANKEQP